MAYDNLEDAIHSDEVQAWLNGLTDADALNGKDLDKLMDYMSRQKAKGYGIVELLLDGSQYWLIVNTKQHRVEAHMSRKWGRALLHLWDLSTPQSGYQAEMIP